MKISSIANKIALILLGFFVLGFSVYSYVDYSASKEQTIRNFLESKQANLQGFYLFMHEYISSRTVFMQNLEKIIQSDAAANVELDETYFKNLLVETLPLTPFDALYVGREAHADLILTLDRSGRQDAVVVKNKE